MVDRPEQRRANEGAAELQPEGVRTHTYLIYDRETGDVVGGHKAVLLPGGEVPHQDQLIEHALSHTSRATGRKPEDLRAKTISEDELQPGLGYRVDPKTERLQGFELPQSSERGL